MKSNLRKIKTNPNNTENLVFGLLNFFNLFNESNDNKVILYIKDLPSPLYTYKALGCIPEI